MSLSTGMDVLKVQTNDLHHQPGQAKKEQQIINP